MIRFNKHHVTNGTVKARVHYSIDNRADRRSCVTLYAKDFDSGDMLGAMFGDAYKNDTDTMSDYFDKGKVVLFEDHPLYAAARLRVEGRAPVILAQALVAGLRAAASEPARLVPGSWDLAVAYEPVPMVPWREWVQANATPGVPAPMGVL